MNSVYVYALVDRPRRAMTVRGRRIDFVPVGGFVAAIDRRRRPPALTEAALRDQHRVVVALARRSQAILPARFGAWTTVSELDRVVTLRSGLLRQAFEDVRDRAQMTVRVFGERGAPAAGRPATDGTAYLRERRTSSLTHLPSSAAALRRAVAGLVVKERLDRGSGSLLATVHHLVDRSADLRYRSIATDVQAHAHAGTELIVSGPWPPFAFAPDLW